MNTFAPLRADAPPVLLTDYSDSTRRHILGGRGLITEAHVPDGIERDRAEYRLGVTGFGSWRYVGILGSRRRIFIAIYGTEDALVLRVGSAQFKWPDDTLSARRDTVFPGVKRFLVYRGRERLLHHVYCHIDRETWPDNGDILSYVERATRSRGEIVRTIHFWAAHARGQNVLESSFAAELERLAREADRAHHE